MFNVLIIDGHDQEFYDLIDRMTEAELRYAMKTLGDERPSLREYFKLRYLPRDKSFYKFVHSKVNRIIHDLSGVRCGERLLRMISHELGTIISEMPRNRISARFLMAESYRMNSRLSGFEDDDEVLLETIKAMVRLAVQYLNTPEAVQADLEIFFRYTRDKSKYDWAMLLIPILLLEVKKDEIRKPLFRKFERALRRRDTDLPFSRNDKYALLADYYEYTDDVRYIEHCERWRKVNPAAVIRIMEYYHKKGHNYKVLEYGWDDRLEDEVFEILLSALSEMKLREKTLDLFCDRLKEYCDEYTLYRFFSIEGVTKYKPALDTIEMLLKDKNNAHVHETILFRLGRYKEYPQAVKNSGLPFTPRRREDLFLNASFLKDIDKEIATAVYRIIAESDFPYLGHTKDYEELFRIIRRLDEMGDREYADHYIQRILDTYRKRGRLINRLRYFIKYDRQGAESGLKA